MLILANVDWSSNKKLINLLKNIFGLGYHRANLICSSLGVDPNIKLKDLKKEDIQSINSIIDLKYKFVIDMDLKKNVYDNIQLLKNIKSYKGVRHTYKLPVNGQRTHTNAKTQRWK